MCSWEQDVVRWRHSLHARPVHLQSTFDPLRLVAIMHIEQGRGSHHHGIWSLGMYLPWSTEGPVQIASSRGDIV